MYYLNDNKTCYHQHGDSQPNNILGNINTEPVVNTYTNCHHKGEILPPPPQMNCPNCGGMMPPPPPHPHHHGCRPECPQTYYQTSTSPAEYNFIIQKGITLDFDVIYKDSSKCGVNLTGYTAKLVAEYNDKIITPTVKIIDPTHGVMKIYMSAYETSKIYTLSSKYAETTQYTYRLDITSPGKNTYRILQGEITVVPAAGC